MEKTAMQMAIDHYKKLSEQGSNQAYVVAKFLEENFLPKEKEQMCKFAYKCHNHYKVNGDFKIEQYYNETFKSENIVMFMTPENGEIESIILTDNPDCGVKGITFKSE